MKKYSLIAMALFGCFTVFAQVRNPFYIGHSLVNEDLPAMVQALAVDAGLTTHYNKQLINGATMSYNWEHHATASGMSYQSAFPGGNFNTLVITEAVPLQNHLTWSNSFLAANNFYNYAKNNNNGEPIRFYIYETWHCKNSGIPQTEFPTGCAYDDSENSNTLWQPRLLLDFPLWSGIVSHVRDQNPTDNEIWMVPAGQAFYNLTNQINAGNLPGMSNVFSLFSDDIHLTNAGNYFVACVMYATIYRQSPVGLTSSISDQWGTPYTNLPTTAQALIMQQVAWQTVTDLSAWSGVTSSLSNDVLENQKITIYPNPAANYITLDTKENTIEDVLIYNSLGALVKKESLRNKTINISELPTGLYFIRFQNSSLKPLKFIKGIN
ncbi:T9SS type A sorting domain-containing protein [Flavobacterium psychraquaticum]|uniref:T9SS type A sorting domain-containing protein n=1 Tax=Flavobacterium psychraquaticum TaxID=3103958 RepID=UPI002ACD4C2F|nr:T9SS type A sorting domain-containing protein [Flavobacterium sp. LB-N7T]